VVPTYEELASRNRDLDAELRLLAERNRTLEALLKAEQDRAVHEREQREALAEKHSFTERVLADLKKNYALLQQEHELLRRRVFEAKAERIDSKQLELELEKTKTELDAMREQIEHATGTKLDDETDSPKTRTRNRPGDVGSIRLRCRQKRSSSPIRRWRRSSPKASPRSRARTTRRA